MRKKICIISDLAIDLIVKKLKNNLKNFNVFYEFHDNISSRLQNGAHEEDCFDIYIIYYDNYFKKYSDIELKDLIDNIEFFAQKKAALVIIPNLVNGTPRLNYHSNWGSEELNNTYKIASKNVIYFDLLAIILSIGKFEFYNYTTGFHYQMPYKKLAIDKISTELSELVVHFFSEEKKLVLVDLDNTLWGGILGEDGINGIRCDKNASGILYFHFQQFLLELKAKGFLLGIVSKNNFSDVEEVFKQRRFPLSLNDFIIKKISWDPKYEAIASLESELGISSDSYIYIDDSEFEINSVNTLLPNVTTFLFKNEYEHYLNLISNYVFKRKNSTIEDASKTDQYFSELNRKELKTNSSSFEDYISNLQIVNQLSVNSEIHLDRISQMTGKTNQFNFNKIFYSEAELAKCIENGNYIFDYKSSDKFGDYGIIGVAIVFVENSEAILHNMLISCRALGRKIEDSFFEEIVGYLNKKNVAIKEIEFNKTAKNSPAENFYKKIKLYI